jgi:S-DNA-T family DNA segregation ATPase FtsK/SpoIIIE
LIYCSIITNVEHKQTDKTFGVLLFLSALLFGLVIFLTSRDFIFISWVQKLISAFGAAVFYLPVYFAGMAYLFYSGRADSDSILLANLTFIPFLTLALALKTLFYSPEQASVIENFMVNLFGAGAPVILFGLLALEALILLRIAADRRISDAEPLSVFEQPASADELLSQQDDEEPQTDLLNREGEPFFEYASLLDEIEKERANKLSEYDADNLDLELLDNDAATEASPSAAVAATESEELLPPLTDNDFAFIESEEQPEETFDNEMMSALTDNDFSFISGEEQENTAEKLTGRLEQLAYGSGGDERDDGLIAEQLRKNADMEFLDELEKSEDRPKPPPKPEIDVEKDFRKQKENIEQSDFWDKDPALDFLSDNDNLPPHLRPSLFSAEESAALSEAAHDIAQNSIEETQIANIIQDASKELDKALQPSEPPPVTAVNPEDDEPSIWPRQTPPEEKKNNPEELTPQDVPEPLPVLTDEPDSGAVVFSVPPEESGDESFDMPDLPETFSLDAEDIEELPDVGSSESPEVFSAESQANTEDLLPVSALHDDAGSDDEEEVATFESVDDAVKETGYAVPVENILDNYEANAYWEIDEETRQAAETLESTLREFKIEAKVTAIRKGPVITMYELLPAPGVKLSRIEGLSDNIAFRLAASRVRIVAPIPGKQAVGIEVPNKERALVSFGEIIRSPEMQDKKNYIPLAVGKDIEGENQVIDLAKTPHLLIAGSTGSGKSVCVNGIICSVLYTRSPHDVRMILIDPKVVELKPYNDIPHLLTPVITEAKKALQAVQWTIYEMERRYSLLDGMGAKNIRTYNKKIKENSVAALPLPYIVVIIDEFADLIATCGKELEIGLARLAAKSRAAGIHLILATQRPSTDVITGLIKANFPSRIAFMVASKVDSRIILDMSGAEQLLGKGDMLFISSWNPFPVRMQGAFLSEDEVDNVTAYVKTLGEPDYIDDQIFYEDDEESFDASVDDEDPLFNKALEIVVEQNKASASYLQRRLKIGYNRAARLVELMEERGLVGPANGSKPRDVLKGSL